MGNREASSPSKSSNLGSVAFNSPSSQQHSNQQYLSTKRITSGKNRTKHETIHGAQHPFKAKGNDLKDVVIQGTSSIRSAVRGSLSPSGANSVKKPKYHKRDDLQIAVSKDNTEGYQSSADGGGSGSKLRF